MANIKNMKHTDHSYDQYLAGDKGIIVYLESSSDKNIFDKWFGEFNDSIVFESISGQKSDGGCGRVISYLEDYDNDDTTKVEAYGVVDRDALLGIINNSAEPTGYDDTWWNPTDDEFYSSLPFGEKIYILNRWELENYLLHPLVLKRVIENETSKKITFSSDEEIAKKIIENESDLVAVTVFSTLAGRGGNKVGGTGRFQTNSGDDLWDEINKALPEITEDEVQIHKEKILSFAEEAEGPIDRWDRLSRMLDGKRVMKRLDSILGNQKIQLDTRCHYLADYVMEFGKVDPHLHGWLSAISSRL